MHTKEPNTSAGGQIARHEPRIEMGTLSHFARTTGEKNLGLVVVTHLLETAVPFLRALAQAFEIAAVIPIPYSVDQGVLAELEHEYRIVVPVTIEDISRLAREEVKRAVGQHQMVALQEIGGYCADDTPYFATFPNFVGVVEDTKNGHWRYLAAADLAVPTLSIAASPLKALENYQVGRTVVDAFETTVRRNFYRIPAEMHVGVMGFGGVGHATARALAARGARVSVYDPDSIRMARALIHGFAAVDRDEILTRCDAVVGVSGSRSVLAEDFDRMKDGVILASGSSKRVEMDVDHLRSTHKLVAEREIVAEYQASDGRSRFLLNEGMPINFTQRSVLGAVLDLVYTELFFATLSLVRDRWSVGVHQLPVDEHRAIAEVWCRLHPSRAAQ